MAEPETPLTGGAGSTVVAGGTDAGAPWRRLLTLREVEAAGAALLAPGPRAYYAGAAADEVTLADNQAAFGRWRFVPRVLVPIDARDPSMQVLGEPWPLPVAIAPMALHRLGHPDGELATARAAAARGLVLMHSTMASATTEEVRATGVRTWFQLYLLRDRGRSRELLDRAAAAGCEAVVLTVDTPMVGLRERDVRDGYALPPDVRYALIQRPAAGRGAAYGEDQVLDSYGWDDLAWVLGATRLPVVVKGVLHPDDARRAVDLGSAAIIVSNHGGRQLDQSIAALDALPSVVAAVADRVPVLLDGGIRRGTDVLIALALGARAVLLGRPVLMALPLGGEAAVGHVLDLLANEIDRALALSGVPRARDARPELLVRAGTVPRHGG